MTLKLEDVRINHGEITMNIEIKYNNEVDEFSWDLNLNMRVERYIKGREKEKRDLIDTKKNKRFRFCSTRR